MTSTVEDEQSALLVIGGNSHQNGTDFEGGIKGGSRGGLPAYSQDDVLSIRSCLSSACCPHGWKWLLTTAVLLAIGYAALGLPEWKVSFPTQGNLFASNSLNSSLATSEASESTLSSPISRAVVDDGTPRLSVEEWLLRSEELSFLLHHGVDTNSMVGDRRRSRRIAPSAVELLHSHVQRHQLVEEWDNLLIVGVVNFGYIDLAYSWLCFMRRLGLTNFVLGTVDAASQDALIALGYEAHVLSLHVLFNDSALEACGGNQGHAWQSVCFNKQTQAKSLLVLTSLFAGYDTLLCDMDISIIHNPFLYMPLSHTWEMQLEPAEFNTGWYFSKASAQSIRMQHELLDVYDSHDGADDQVSFNLWVKAYRSLRPKELKEDLFTLNRALFPNGQGDHYASASGVIQHNNYLVGVEAKRTRQKEKGLALYNADSTNAKLAEAKASQSPPSTSSLVCDECVACQSMKPSAPPLRDHFPGPLKTTDFTPYFDAPPF